MSDLVIGPDGLARPPWASSSELLHTYYDTEWGLPVRDERGVFERISLEVFEVGMSWAIILSKRENFRRAFANFEPDEVASFGEAKVAELLADASIVRNEAKIRATISNAEATIRLREHGGLAELVWSFQPDTTPMPKTLAEIPTTSKESEALAKALKQAGFKFVGPTSMFALMAAIGLIDTHLIGSHRRGCSGLWRDDGTRA